MNTTRRNFFQALAVALSALPIVGGLFKSSTAPLLVSFDVALSEGDRAAVAQYLAKRHGIPFRSRLVADDRSVECTPDGLVRVWKDSSGHKDDLVAVGRWE